MSTTIKEKIRKIIFRILHTIIGIMVLICLPFFWVAIFLWDNTGFFAFYEETFQYLLSDEPWGPLDGCFSTKKS